MSTTDIRVRRSAVVATALALALVASGCASGSRSGSDQPGVPDPPRVSTAAPDPAQQTPISTSSEDDLAAALRTNGVQEPQHWAQVVVSYRPYPPGEPGQAKLRQVLVQFRADPDTTTKVTTALVP